MAKLTLPTAYELFERPRPPRLPHPDIIKAEKERSESAEPGMEVADRECARLLANACLYDPPLTDSEIRVYADHFGITFHEAESELRELRNDS